MIPIPPTIREMEAMEPKRRDMTPADCSALDIISVRFLTEKSFS